jgi:dipeptidyl aminopeptidase/acylaminoacyl peptidase
VLQLDFRGSKGYGQDFREAGRRRWGLEMQDGVKLSPALRAAEIRVPVLLMHGANDLTVPVEQSRDMADALKKANHADARYVELPLGDHGLSR